MSRFRLREIRVDNYRCFEELRLSLEEDITVLFAENGGGKTALLTALAMGLAVFQSGAPRTLKLDPRRDPTMRTLDEKGRREPVGSVQARVDCRRGPIGIRHVVNGSSSRVRTHHEPEQSDSRSTGANSSARISLAVVRVVRRRSFGADPRTASQGRADRGPLGSLRLRARPEPRRGPAASVAPG